MSRLVWGASSERFYEAGVDRGVLYTTGSDGVAWSGLVSVTESPSGGDARPFYLDGVKYLNLSSMEEFEGTIEAIGTPEEFLVCDGLVSVHNGLFAAQQPRVSFGFTYRTLIGNDIDSIQHGYKIHILYNVLTAPSQRIRRTLGSSSDPTVMSWQITTLPPDVIGYKRTGHYIIDTRYSDPDKLADAEDALYGTDSTAAVLPTPDELIAIFAV